MIKLINVNKYYQSGSEKIHVIKDLSYEFPDKGLVFILGPSGSGKSTLLNLLGGLDKPDSGEIWIEDKEISSFSKKDLNQYLNSYLGFVFQEYNIFKDLNLRENISLSLEIQGKSRKIKKNKVAQIIKEVELEGLEKRKVSQLSGGQRQRIAIARALVKDPELIIADEPTGNLDSETSKKVFELFKKLSRNRLIVIVTHDEESALTYADDIIRIDTANIESNDEPMKHTTTSSDLEFSSRLHLEKAKVPMRTITKLAFKNLWQKKLRFLLMFIISTLSLTFLSFAIELNGDKLYQNVYTTINNGNNYTDIYQLDVSTNKSKSNDFYTKYQKGELMSNAYTVIKSFAPELVVHKYQNVEINYSKYNIEKANLLYSGVINTIIYFDNSNDYKLIAGRLPKADEPEIIITDFLFDALKHFGIINQTYTIYDILNTYLDLGYLTDFKVVGVMETNYRNWLHLSRLRANYKIDSYDKSMQGFEYDYRIMNSIVVGEKYYNYILSDTFQNTKITVNSYTLQESSITTYESQVIKYGRAPENSDEIVIPYSLAQKVFSLADYNYNSWYIKKYILDEETKVMVTTKFNEVETDTGAYEMSAVGTFKVVGFSASRDFLLSESGYNSFNQAIEKSKVTNDAEKVIVELPKDPSTALSIFKKLYNNDYHFIIDVFKYRDYIESYSVDPLVEFASKGGLVVFCLLTIGILWTIISIEIVDSRKEIGIMRSIGLSGSKVSLIFVIQSVFINVLAYFASIPLAKQLINAFGKNITDAMGEIRLSMYSLTYRTPLFLIVFVLMITLVSTFIPLIKIMSKKIINVINERDE